MQPAEMRDAGALTGVALGEVAEIARDVHRAVADRVFGLLGTAAAPARLMHDGIAAIAYTSTRAGLRTLPAAAGATAGELAPPSVDSAHATPRGHFLLNVLNGFWGDRIAAERPSLAPELTMRTHRGPLRRLPANVAHDAAADATASVAVFVHGLCENDRFWWLGAEKQHGDPDCTYGSRLRADAGWTPLYASYNSGLHVSDNAAELSAALDRLVAAWPVPIARIALVGHSMGGLVVRGAAHHGDAAGAGWVSSLRHVVSLGAPHLGAPLERVVNAGTHLMGRLPETRPFATWLNRRSVGIKDLRYGAIVANDWAGFDPDERLVDRCAPATMVPGVIYSAASATLSREPRGAFAHDLLVQHASAHGIGPVRRIGFDPAQLFHVGGKTHLHLLNDPLVYAQLRSWLEAADQTVRNRSTGR